MKETININVFTRIRGWFNTKSPVFPTRVSLFACILLAFGGISLGLYEDSLAVLTNGLISAVDIFNSALFMTAVNHSMRSPDYVFNYGYGKYESISILTAALLLSVVMIYTIVEAVRNFGMVEPAGGNYFILVSFSAVSLLVMMRMHRLQRIAAKRFHMPILQFDSESWKIDSYIEAGVLANLLIGAILQQSGYMKIAIIIDSITAVLLLLFALKVPLKGSRDALNQLLDRTLPENVQFDILAVVAENLSRMCEFKEVHTRQSGKDIFIEIDIIMPYDFKLEQIVGLEKDMQEALKEKYPTAVPRIYVTPCSKDCVHYGKSFCPVKIELEKKQD